MCPYESNTMTRAGVISALLKSGGRVCGETQKYLHELAVSDSLHPIAPGGIGNAPFWNICAKQFIYAPSFLFKTVPGAVRYRFNVMDPTGKIHSFLSESPTATLSAVWAELPVGFCVVSVDGLDENGEIAGDAGSRKFYRGAVFTGNYPGAMRPYRTSAVAALEYLFCQEYFQSWRENWEQPHPDYELYCYPTKIMSSVIESMLLYADLDPVHQEVSLEIARHAADYLISISNSAESPLAFFPPTYRGELLKAKEDAGQQMMIYPATAALQYVKLYEVCGEEKYLTAGLRIAETYRKTQLSNGSWYLKVWNETGVPLVQNICIPLPMIELFEYLEKHCGKEEYHSCMDRALYYIRENALRQFNWEGQFEDIAPAEPYSNNSKHDAGSYALYLLRQERLSAEDAETVRTLIRYAEDQFVVWEKPLPSRENNTQDWITPCVLEQYAYYVPIDASASKLLRLYTESFRSTGSVLDLAKACALANAMTHAQIAETGRYMTYWEHNERGQREGWINCATDSARSMLNLADLLDSLQS